MHVIVIGGGIGGLALAQGLRNASVGVAVYEKSDPNPPSSWQQGYQIHINAAGSAALKACLPEATRELFDANVLQPSDGLQVLTEQLEPVRYMPPEAFGGSNRILRTALRRVLLAGLDDVVQFGTTFVRYEGGDQGGIRAIFEDGSSARGDVLVGADGVGSKVRAQLRPDARIADTGLVGMAGKLPLTDRSRSYLPEHLLTRLSSIRAPGGLYMVVTQSMQKPDGTGEEPDHTIWVLVSSRDAYGSQPRSLFHDGAKLQAIALHAIDEWHPSLQLMIAETDPAQISATSVQGAEPVQAWETSAVTLLGDAIHAMPPLMGLGGGTALRDAASLCRKLVEAERGEKPLLPALHDYEAAMLEYGFDAVRASMQMAGMVSSGAAWRGDFFRHPSALRPLSGGTSA